MVDTVIKYRVCDRCPGEVLAEAPHKLTVDGWRYEIDLCAEHWVLLKAMLDEWTLAGTLLGEPTVFDKVRPYSVPPEYARKVLPTAPEEVTYTGPVVADIADKWFVTEHAQLRMTERGIRLDEVLRAAEWPERVTASTKREGHYVHRRGDVKVVTHAHKIITVARPDADDDASTTTTDERMAASGR